MRSGEDTRTGPFAPPPGETDATLAPCLIVIRGLNVGETFPLREGEHVVGRGQQADVDLPDEGVARRHATVRVAGGEALLTDLGSRSGTFVNGNRLEGPVALRGGDRIQVSAGTILKLTHADRQDQTFQRRLYESSLRDPLTQSFNRRYFLDRLERELRFAHRHGQPLSLILVDVDGLQAVNESLGSGVGDAVLAELASRVHDGVRQEDVVARTGGDELAVICRATDSEAALAIAERLRAAVADRTFGERAGAQVTVSTGVAGMASGGASHELLAAASAALSEAKRAGRNCVRVAGDPG